MHILYFVCMSVTSCTGICILFLFFSFYFFSGILLFSYLSKTIVFSFGGTRIIFILKKCVTIMRKIGVWIKIWCMVVERQGKMMDDNLTLFNFYHWRTLRTMWSYECHGQFLLYARLQLPLTISSAMIPWIYCV